MPTLPDKIYFKIGEVARMAEVPSHVLRYWESEFSAIRPKRTNSGQRLYKREDVVRILKIRTLLYEKGYTISGAKKLLGKKAEKVQEQALSESGDTTLENLRKLKVEVQKLQEIISS